MDLPTALSSIVDLVESVGDDRSINEPLTALGQELRSAVGRYAGLRLIIFSDGYPVTLTVADGTDSAAPIRSSVRLRLALLVPVHVDSTITFYARTAGAFADLAADLDRDLRRLARLDGGTFARAVVDDDFPVGLVSGLTGLAELSVVSRALGMLIAQGHRPEDAHGVLSRRAARAGLGQSDYAGRMLGRRSQAPEHC